MKRKFIWAGSFVLAAMAGKAQKSDTVFKKDRVKPTEIEFLYSHYFQEGNNSAVTGGIGTEQLTVIAPQVSLLKTYKTLSSLHTKFGVDVITSASTDNIDFVKSSASMRDARTHLDVIYTRPVKKNISVSFGGGFSIESDYFSLPFSAGLLMVDKEGSRTLGIDFQSYFDDLRWGRLSPSSAFSPQKLIYPEELRNRNWFNEYRRQSYNLRLSFTQVLNKRNRIGIYPEFSYQRGLLSTPFHRVYFSDGSLRVENLPNERWKASLGIKLNTFVGGRVVLKHSIDLYSDSFVVRGVGVENETAIKITPAFTIVPQLRIYLQNGSVYFSAYKTHNPSQDYYTSDYDLSAMTTGRFGVAVRHIPVGSVGKRNGVLEISYLAYRRSNALTAHIISCSLLLK